MTDESNSRRQVLKTVAAAGAGVLCGLAAGGAAAAESKPKERVPMRFDDPIWNRDTVAKLNGHVDPAKQVFGAVSGVVNGVRDGERVRTLMRFEVFSALRILPQPDGSYQRLCRELIFYRDPITGKLMEEWDNPYTGERVKVVDVANDPFNYKISEFFPDPPSYGGLNKEKPPKRPFLMRWAMISDDVVSMESDIHLYYPSALRPEKWPRESPGPMSRVSELFRYFMRREDVENPALTHIPHHGTWSRITPWLPWMLMDQAQGHIAYLGNFTTRENLDHYPKDVIQRIKERFPQYLEAPKAWSEPSLSSLEHYALEQKPAPAKAKP